jgi:DNA-binding MarR family transcriptional regulator
VTRASAPAGPQPIPVSLISDSAKKARLISLINMAARLTNRAARIRLGPLGAWPGQIPLLLWLIADDGLIQKELVSRSKMEQPTVAEHLDRLEKDGFITRKRATQDRRKYQVFLTAKGRSIASDLIEELENGAETFTKGISKQDLLVFDRVICQIIERLETFIRDSESAPAQREKV